MLVLRHGELFLKGANRHRFVDILLQNIRRGLRDIAGVSIKTGQGRVFVVCDDLSAEPEVERRLSRVFGLSSVSTAVEAEPTIEALGEAAADLAQETVDQQPVRSFKVQSRRADKRHLFTSMDLNREVGAAVVRRLGLAVDLHTPELTVGVEVGPRRSFVYVGRTQGAGGLPVGASGRVALLLSGGIDSPVAGHLMQKRGCRLTAVYFHSPPYTGERTTAKVSQLAEKLAPAQGDMTLNVVPFTAIQKQIRDLAPREYAVVLYRRSMVRIAAALARQASCQALASGDNLGQVASQTLANLACIEDASPLPILRPLLTYDKIEIIALARQLGTYDLSIEPYDDCCSLFVPKHPATAAKAHRARRMESRLDLDPLEQEAIATVDARRLADGLHDPDAEPVADETPNSR